MKFIFETQDHKTISSTPHRCTRLKRSLKRLGIIAFKDKEVRKIDNEGTVYYPAYSKPLMVNNHGSIVEFIPKCGKKEKLTLENELNLLYDRVTAGIIDKKECQICFDALIEMFREEKSDFWNNNDVDKITA